MKDVRESNTKFVKTMEYPMSKKGNMAYWDSIDNISEEYVKQLLEYDMSDNKASIDDDTIVDLAKQITEYATTLLENNVKALFPYVDENY